MLGFGATINATMGALKGPTARAALRSSLGWGAIGGIAGGLSDNNTFLGGAMSGAATGGLMGGLGFRAIGGLKGMNRMIAGAGTPGNLGRMGNLMKSNMGFSGAYIGAFVGGVGGALSDDGSAIGGAMTGAMWGAGIGGAAKLGMGGRSAYMSAMERGVGRGTAAAAAMNRMGNMSKSFLGNSYSRASNAFPAMFGR